MSSNNVEWGSPKINTEKPTSPYGIENSIRSKFSPRELKAEMRHLRRTQSSKIGIKEKEWLIAVAHSVIQV